MTGFAVDPDLNIEELSFFGRKYYEKYATHRLVSIVQAIVF
jgi:hypothetical protein